ncbi:MAG TPA: DsbC family protein [Dissulfurispiraceae bacterium]|nr:DsbC family protein [Dissulfurispiraceae bacterium]
MMVRFAAVFAAVMLFFHAVPAHTFSDSGCDGDCKKCHSITNDDVVGMLKKMNSDASILGIQMSPVKGLWEVTVDDKGRKGVFYTDFSKKFMVAGPIIALDNGPTRVDQIHNSRKVDVSRIPLDDAVVLGSHDAQKKVIVFTDPDCPFCARLHKEMKKVVEERKDIAFYIKLYPLPAHKDAYWKAGAIECRKSLTMMEDNFAGRPISNDNCGTKEIDDNIRLAKSLGVLGTPTLILPDGTVHEGTLPADKLIGLIDGR